MMIEVGDLIPHEDAKTLCLDGMAQIGESLNRIEGRLIGIPHNLPIEKVREVKAWLDELRRAFVKRIDQSSVEDEDGDVGGEPSDADDTTNESEPSK